MNKKNDKLNEGKEYDFSKSFVEHLNELYEKTHGLSGTGLRVALLENARNEEEKKGMKETFQDNDLYNQKEQELKESGLPAGEWFENEVENMATELFADKETGKVTEQDMNEVKAAVRIVMDDKLKGITDQISAQIDELNKMYGKEESNNQP